MEKSLFKEYEEWCVKENKDPLKEETVSEFKLFKQKQEKEKVAESKNEERNELIKKQEEIFKMLCDYAGVKTKYDVSYMFEPLDRLFKSVIIASVEVNHEKDVDAVVEKLLG